MLINNDYRNKTLRYGCTLNGEAYKACEPVKKIAEKILSGSYKSSNKIDEQKIVIEVCNLIDRLKQEKKLTQGKNLSHDNIAGYLYKWVVEIGLPEIFDNIKIAIIGAPEDKKAAYIALKNTKMFSYNFTKCENTIINTRQKCPNCTSNNVIAQKIYPIEVKKYKCSECNSYFNEKLEENLSQKYTDTIKECPNCHESDKVIKKGKFLKLVRKYLCLNCNKNFQIFVRNQKTA